MISKIKFNNLEGSNIGLGNVKLKDTGGTELPGAGLSAIASSDDGSNLPANVLYYSESINALWTFTGHADSVNALATDSGGNIYSASDDNTIKKIDPDGTEITTGGWPFTGHTQDIYDLAVDSAGNIYSASADHKVKKIRPDGTEVWTFTGHAYGVNEIAVDSGGNVYSGSYHEVKKINSDGTEAWTFNGYTGYVYALAVDSAGNVYSGDYTSNVKKINPDGTAGWVFEQHTKDVKALTVDSAGNIYSGSTDNTVKKINPDGTEAWTFTGHTGDVRALATDSAGNIYSGSLDNTVKKINPDGTLGWTFTGHTSGVEGVVVDSAGNIYSGGVDNTVKKINQTPTASYWQNNGTEESSYLEVTLNSVQDLSEVSFIPKPTNSVGTTKPIDIEVYDENNNMLFSQIVEPDTNVGGYKTYIPNIDNTKDLIKTVKFEGLESTKNIGLGNIKVKDYKGVAFSDTMLTSLATSENATHIDDNVSDYDRIGSGELWSYDNQYPVYMIEIDDNGYIYTGQSSVSINKVDPSTKEVVKSVNTGSAVTAMALDNNNNNYVYCAGVGPNKTKIRKINIENETLVKEIDLVDFSSRDLYNEVRQIITDSFGFLHIFVDGILLKFNTADLSFVDEFSEGLGVTEGEPMTLLDENTLLIPFVGTDYDGVAKINIADYSVIWSFTHFQISYSVIITDQDSAGNVYFADSVYLIKVNPATDNVEFKVEAYCEEYYQETSNLSDCSNAVIDENDRLFIGYECGYIEERSIIDGSVINTYKEHTDGIVGLKIGMDGNMYSASKDAYIKKWNILEIESFWQNGGVETSSSVEVNLSKPLPIKTVDFVPRPELTIMTDKIFKAKFLNETGDVLKEITVSPISDLQKYQTISYLLNFIFKGDDGTGTFVLGEDLTPGTNKDIEISVENTTSEQLVSSIPIRAINTNKYWYVEINGTPISITNNGDELIDIPIPNDISAPGTVDIKCGVEVESSGSMTISPIDTKIKPGEILQFKQELDSGDYKEYTSSIPLPSPVTLQPDTPKVINVSIPTDIFSELKNLDLNGNIVNVNKNVPVKLKV